MCIMVRDQKSFKQLSMESDMEYFIHLEDADGTGYGADIEWFEDLNEARLYAKSQVKGHIVVVKICSPGGDVVDFFQ